MSARGTARTTAALAALPDGAVFVVAFRQEKDVCRRILASLGREPSCIKLVPLSDIARALRGLPRATVLDVDHFCYDVMTDEQRQLLRIFRHLYTIPPIARGN